MQTKGKPAPEANREAGYDIALNSHNHSPIYAQLKALLIGIAAYDPALLALAFIFALWPILALWGALR
jgi:hypothetical protein